MNTWTHDSAAPMLARALQVVEPEGEVVIEDGDVVVRYAAVNEGTATGDRR